MTPRAALLAVLLAATLVALVDATCSCTASGVCWCDSPCVLSTLSNDVLSAVELSCDLVADVTTLPPNLITLNGTLTASSITRIIAPGLVSARRIELSGPELTVVEFDALRDTDAFLLNNTNVSVLSLPSLEQSGSFEVSANALLSVVSLGLSANMLTLTIRDSPALSSLTLGAQLVVSNALTLRALPQLCVLDGLCGVATNSPTPPQLALSSDVSHARPTQWSDFRAACSNGGTTSFCPDPDSDCRGNPLPGAYCLDAVWNLDPAEGALTVDFFLTMPGDAQVNGNVTTTSASTVLLTPNMTLTIAGAAFVSGSLIIADTSVLVVRGPAVIAAGVNVTLLVSSTPADGGTYVPFLSAVDLTDGGAVVNLEAGSGVELRDCEKLAAEGQRRGANFGVLLTVDDSGCSGKSGKGFQAWWVFVPIIVVALICIVGIVLLLLVAQRMGWFGSLFFSRPPDTLQEDALVNPSRLSVPPPRRGDFVYG